MKLCIWHTGHDISEGVCARLSASMGVDLRHIDDVDAHGGEYDAHIAYGILRGTARLFSKTHNWFELDRGFWSARHYDGLYRLSFRGTQPRWSDVPVSLHSGVALDEWRDGGGYTLICPPTDAVCEFFGVDGRLWLQGAMDQDEEFMVRTKGAVGDIDWSRVGKVVTFNSSVGFEALRRGIPVASDPVWSTIGTYVKAQGSLRGYDRRALFDFAHGHQVGLSEGGRAWGVVRAYRDRGWTYTLAGTAGRQWAAT